MTKEEHIAYWVNGAQDNLDAAFTIYSSQRYDWSLYVAHLAIEKLLKALYIQHTDNFVPPKIHNLLKLMELSATKTSDEQKELLSDMNRFQIEARYPEIKYEFKKIATKEFTDMYLSKIKEIYTWLKSQIK
jgi:HEPN domain-containing protein